LEQSDGTPVFSADDTDLGDLNRLTLLAAVRGLESIEGPSNVTLLSNNRYLIRSLSDSLPRWRQNDFVWEHFGRRIDVQHADLWRRIDRALSIHRVEAVLISSRLVSRGIGHQTLAAGPDDVQLRFDSPQRAVRRPKSDRTVKPETAAQPQDQLRQWLIGNANSNPRSTAGNRFTTADLLQAT
jgi:ribonuclease HI